LFCLFIVQDECPEADQSTVVEDHPGNNRMLPLLDGSGYFKKRLKRKVIRFRHYGKKQDIKNYSREQLMLFFPWRDEETDLLLINVEEVFKEKLEIILENSKPFYYDRKIDDLILQDLAAENETEIDEEEGNTALSNNLELLQEEDVFELDLNEDQSPSNLRVESFLPPKLVPQEEYLRIMRTLNEKQRRFVLNIIHLMKTSTEPFSAF